MHFSLLDPNDDPAPVKEGLEKASGFLRSRLGREVKIRHVPELRFAHDDSAAEAQRISSLIDGALDSNGRERVMRSERNERHADPVDGLLLLNKPSGMTSNRALQA